MFKGIEVKRFFTGGCETPEAVFGDVQWKVHPKVNINDDTGKTVFHRDNVEAPAFWSDQAVRIVASKFLHDEIRGTGARGLHNAEVPPHTIAAETSIRQIITRVVNTIAMHGLKRGYFGCEQVHKRATAFRAELTHILLHQRAAFNSPVWFNVGVPDRPPRSSACFINTIEDDLESIFDAVKNEGTIFKYGGGSGMNMSKLRASIERLNGTGSYSSGTVSFMQAFDAFAGVIKSGSIARRAAKMVVLNVDHPDILEFIDSKVKGEQIAQALIAAGFPADFNHSDSAYKYAPFQNANHSVRVTDAFMRAATAPDTEEEQGQHDQDWSTKYVSGVQRGGVAWSMPAHKILRRMAEAAWTCGDPGVQFHDAVNRWNPVIDTHVINGSNPCQPGFATVLTPEGIRTFDDIRVGSTIWSGQRWTKVRRKVATGIKPVFLYVTTAGSFMGTQEHHVFEDGRRVMAQHANAIDRIVGELPREKPGCDPQDVMDGWVMGDGSAHGASNDLILNIGTTITPNELTYTYDRTVPQRFLRGDAQKVRGYLRGLYSAKGSVVDGRVTLKATSLRVIYDVQLMLSSIGIPSYYTTNKPSLVEFGNGTYLCKQSYDLNITYGRDDFARLIGFVQDYKTARLAAACDRPVACKPAKTTYDIKDVQPLGSFEVFDIEVEDEDHSYWTGGLLVSNCSEYMFIDDSACNLASINLVAFELPDGNIDIEALCHTTDVMVLAMEILVGFSTYPNKKIEQNSHDYRPLGLGYANLGALLMRQGLAYDSDEGRSLSAALTALILARSYRRSGEMARDCGGPFAKWETVKRGFMHVIEKHNEAIRKIRCNPNTLIDRIRVAACEDIDVAGACGRQYGFRNGQVVVIAPTGTIGFMMDVDTTGIEPALALVSMKKLVGGGTERIVNKSVAMALKRLGYVAVGDLLHQAGPENVDSLLHKWIRPEHHNIFATALGANAIPWEAHVKMLAAVQPFVSGSISKTINMPNSATVEDIEKAYVMAWRMGLKCLAVYRDGCKQSQPVTPVGATKLEQQKQHSFNNKVVDLPEPRVSVSFAVMLRALNTHGAHAKEQPCSWGIDCPQITPPFEGAALQAALPNLGPQRTDTTTRAETRLADLLKLAEQPCATCGKELKTTQPLVITTEDTALHHLGCFKPSHPARRKLPREVRSIRVKYNIGGHKGYFHVGHWPEGDAAEIWFESNKEGSFVSGLLSALGVFMSLCLQYGVPLAKIVEKLEHTSFPPSGFTGEGPPIASASSILDYLAKWLAFRYLGRGGTPLGKTFQNGVPAVAADPSLMVAQKITPEAELNAVFRGESENIIMAIRVGDGPPCPICHTPMERSGSCHHCPNCGNTSGCS